MEQQHKHFIQFMIKKSYRQFEECVYFFENGFANYEITENKDKFNDFIAIINNRIKAHGLQIIVTVCEVTGKEIVMLINTIQDELTKTQPYYSTTDMKYFDTILKEIVTTDSHKLPKSECLNLGMVSNTSLIKAEHLLNKWIDDGYMIEKDDMIYVGTKTIEEFDMNLRNCYEDFINFCAICKKILLTGKTCKCCRCKCHTMCLQKILEFTNKCVNCNETFYDDDDDSDD